MMSRHTTTDQTTTIRWVAKPIGEDRENGPHLADLRAFMSRCAGLPDDTFVHIINGPMNAAGHRDVTFQVTVRESPDRP